MIYERRPVLDGSLGVRREFNLGLPAVFGRATDQIASVAVIGCIFLV
jgi:hypothetical protein